MSRLCSMFSLSNALVNRLSGPRPVCLMSTYRRLVCTSAGCISSVQSRYQNYHPTLDFVRQSSSQGIRPTDSFLDVNHNIFKSPLADNHGFSGVLLHDFVWQKVANWWKRTALECAMTGRTYTYGELRRLSGRLATSLRNKIQPGETVAAVLPNVPEYAILLLGASEAGVQLTLVNPNCPAEEMKRQLESSGAVAVVTVPSRCPTVAESIQSNSVIRFPIIVIDDGAGSPPAGAVKFGDLVSEGIEEFEKTGMKTNRNPSDAVILPYSSGTTGLPKGVELSHTNACATSTFVETAHNVCVTHDQQCVIPVFLPFFHIYGIAVNLIGYLSLGLKLICMPQFSSNALLDVFEKHKVSIIHSVPPVIQMLAYEQRLKKNHLEHLNYIIVGAAPLGENVVTKFLDRAGSHVNLYQGYGLTETTSFVSVALFSKNAPVNSVGILAPNTQVRVVGYTDDKMGKNLGCNELGEIFVRGPQVMNGYYKNLKATEETMEGDWLKTGDLGSFDNDGHLYIQERLKELIKVQAFPVAPAELEDLIQGHENVADVAVIGVKHERYGEIPKAFVVLKPGSTIEEEDIKDYVAARVANHKKLGHVVFVDKIPKSPSGKILRKDLRNNELVGLVALDTSFSFTELL